MDIVTLTYSNAFTGKGTSPGNTFTLSTELSNNY